MKIPFQQPVRGFTSRIQSGRFIFLAASFLTIFLLNACARTVPELIGVSPADCSTPENGNASETCLPENQLVPGQLATMTGSAPSQDSRVTVPNPTFQAESERGTSPAVSAVETQPSPTPLTIAMVNPCTVGQCVYPSIIAFSRPIASPDNDQVDTSYRFGSTQGKQRDPHHGVEFLNPQGTPVMAAADGVVVIAGDDKQTLYSPYFNYYGNLVVIEHDLPDNTLVGIPAFPTPVYTLYAHLSEVVVEAGQIVRQGQEIGRVGMTGGATGSHLHFEVRLGENSYAASRNPELWLKPGQDENGQLMGGLAARVMDEQGRPIAVQDVVIQYLPEGPQGPSGKEIYLQSYEEKELLDQPPWQESFAVGNLPTGWYRVNFPYFGLQHQDVQVFPGQMTVVVFKL